jgi:hypothetical protein
MQGITKDEFFAGSCWQHWSDNFIAEKCGVSQPTVRTLRDEVINFITSQPLETFLDSEENTTWRYCYDSNREMVQKQPAVKAPRQKRQALEAFQLW